MKNLKKVAYSITPPKELHKTEEDAGASTIMNCQSSPYWYQIG